MPRFLLALTLTTALLGPLPAAAQLQPAWPAPPPAAQWVSVGNNVVGTAIMFDAHSIVVDGYYKSAQFRFDRADGSRDFIFIEFDCDGGLYRRQQVVQVEGGYRRVPASDWVAFAEGAGPNGPLASSASREALCNWRG